MRMGLREANQKFSKAIKEVKAGREVVLTERGKPFAVIKPLPSRKTFEAAVTRMIADGRLTGPLHPRPIRRRGWKPVKIQGPPLTDTLREDRDAGG
ncbi:MAG: type II toxin-antitoxin system prevent-host-death family antitoxin [Candidatus Rokubacteria bacterium]|nr:type II toxin-antitoxin system prevent-host-death family antitoxin [Candidatus Rokubacteria bacterium]